MSDLNTSNTFVCKGERLCGFLASHGCFCFKAGVDRTNPEHMVYLFEKTPLWQETMNMWKALRKDNTVNK